MEAKVLNITLYVSLIIAIIIVYFFVSIIRYHRAVYALAAGEDLCGDHHPGERAEADRGAICMTVSGRCYPR